MSDGLKTRTVREIKVDLDKCIGCRACVGACREANGLAATPTTINGAAYDAPIDLDANTKTIIKLYEVDGTRGRLEFHISGVPADLYEQVINDTVQVSAKRFIDSMEGVFALIAQKKRAAAR